MKKGKIFKTLAIAGTCLCAPLLLSGCSNENKNKTDLQNFRVQNGWFQFTQDGETWINLIEAEYPISQYDFRVYNGYVQWTTDGTTWVNLIKAEETKTYTITFDYGAAYDTVAKHQNVMFPIFYPEHRLQSLDVKEGEWIGSLPKCNGVFEDSFLGWFIQGTDKQITEHDYIAGDISLEARFDFASSDAPAGLYQNGKYLKTWEQMIDDADIVVEDGIFSYVDTMNRHYDLHIDNDVTEFEVDAFDNAIGLTGIAIPGTIKSIGDSAFSSCGLLSNVVIYRPFNADNELEVINGFAFSGCKELRNITIPSSVKIIEKSAFSGCDNLTSVTLEENANSLERWVIYDNFYTKNIISQDAVTTLIDRQVASYLKKGYEVMHTRKWCGMDAIDLSDKFILASVSDKNILEYNGVVANLNLDKYCVLDNYAFADCENLVRVKIGSYVDEIGVNIFKNCSSLTDISFEERDGFKWQVYDNSIWRDVESNELFDLAKAGKQLKRVGVQS